MFVFEKVMFRLQSSNERTKKRGQNHLCCVFLLYNAYYGAACVFSDHFTI